MTKIMVWRNSLGEFYRLPIEAIDEETVKKAASQIAVKKQINRKFEYQLTTDEMEQIPFTQAVPEVSFYRHQTWEAGKFKQFRHAHTMAQDLTGFEFYRLIQRKA